MVFIFILIGLFIAAAAAEGYIDYVTALPPLFSGIEAESNLTLERLLENRIGSADMEDDKSNRSIKHDQIAARNPHLSGVTGEWVLARLNRFYETSQKIRTLAEVYSPAREYALLLENEDRYSAEWWATLRLIHSGRYAFSELTNNTRAALAGRLGYAQ
jgi:hypothetical protein